MFTPISYHSYPTARTLALFPINRLTDAFCEPNRLIASCQDYYTISSLRILHYYNIILNKIIFSIKWRFLFDSITQLDNFLNATFSVNYCGSRRIV